MTINFAIGKTDYFIKLGFNVKHWRKSVDGTLCLVHYDFVRYMADVDRLEIYRHDSDEFIALMQSDEWTEQIEENPPK